MQRPSRSDRRRRREFPSTNATDPLRTLTSARQKRVPRKSIVFRTTFPHNSGHGYNNYPVVQIDKTIFPNVSYTYTRRTSSTAFREENEMLNISFSSRNAVPTHHGRRTSSSMGTTRIVRGDLLHHRDDKNRSWFGLVVYRTVLTLFYKYTCSIFMFSSTVISAEKTTAREKRMQTNPHACLNLSKQLV